MRSSLASELATAGKVRTGSSPKLLPGSYHVQIWSLQYFLADVGVALDEGSTTPGLIL
jgi:hypothetical protein